MVDCETFSVEGIIGPVCTGEHDRARSGGRGLACSVQPGEASSSVAELFSHTAEKSKA